MILEGKSKYQGFGPESRPKSGVTGRLKLVLLRPETGTSAGLGSYPVLVILRRLEKKSVGALVYLAQSSNSNKLILAEMLQ